MRSGFLIFIFFVFFFKTSFADDHLKKHIGFSETFFGNEEDYQVCYPKDHKNFFYSIFGFGILATVLGAMIFVVKSRANKQLKAKNLIIEEKNHDLIASITYAKRIQNSILPPKEIISALEKNLFVYYQPRDIVSGDFYWIHQTENILYAAVVDCTGHGVPGAFLSLIGHQAINRAVNEDKLTSPTDILDRMNSYVKTSLQQEKESALKDGMEVALFKLNTTNNTLEFAGANLSLVLIQNNAVNVLKGNKCTVGSIQEHVTHAPITQSVQLSAGDAFYVFSDGFADQMGGKDGKKYKSVKLKETLLRIVNNSPQQQCKELNEEFISWKSNLEQVDDVCLMGYRV
ncbi:MAG: SpoIIE family protein phosphatase [Bacteroidota bacterium]|nr:SpoIIE family protein phosphatase [Bacteroidota bacterium]